MDIFGIIIIAILIAAAVIGCVVGLVKGFTKVKSWGVEYLLAASLSIAVGGICAAQDPTIGSIVTILLSVALIVGFIFLFKLLRLIFGKLIEKKLAGAVEVQNEQSADDEDEEREEKKPKKPSAGFVGFLNRLLGGITLAVKAFVLFGAIFSFILVAFDVLQLTEVTDFVADLYASPTYVSFKAVLFDFFAVGIIMIAIKCGYNSGISNAVWGLVVIGMVALAGYAAFTMANAEAFQPLLDGLTKVIAGQGEISELTVNIARYVLMGLIFAILLVVVILLSVFVPKLMDGLRESPVFNAIDGVFGAIVTLIIVVGVLLAVGLVLQPLSDMEFMSNFNSYYAESKIATYFYGKNILSLYEITLPVKEWLGL